MKSRHQELLKELRKFMKREGCGRTKTQEVELKFFVPNQQKLRQAGCDPFKEVRRKLWAHENAKLVSEGTEVNFYFDTSEEDFKVEGAIVRLRTMSEKTGAMLTLKCKPTKPSRAFKVRMEEEATFPNAGVVRKHLECLGLQESFCYQKNREHWRAGKCFVELDTLPGGTCFVEIEGSPKEIRRVARFLGFLFRDALQASYLNLVREVNKKPC